MEDNEVVTRNGIKNRNRRGKSAKRPKKKREERFVGGGGGGGVKWEKGGGVRGKRCICCACPLPTDFGSHSMLHQTLIPSSFPSHVSSSPLASNAKPTAATASSSCFLRDSSAMPSYAHHHSSLDERMEALKGSSRQEETADEVAGAEAPSTWGLVERDQGFSVEDLLDLEEFCEADKDGADEHGEEPAAANPEKSNGDSQQSSVVSYDLVPHQPPAPEIVDLPAHDVEELEWVSRIMDDSLSELPPQPQPPASMMAPLAARPPQNRLLQRRAHDGAYRALPSASEPLRTPTICALSTEALVPVKAKRSKRSRASGWSLSGTGPLSDSASSSSTTTTSSCSSSASFSPYFLLDAPQLGASDFLEEYHLFPPPTKKSKHGNKNSKHKPKKRGRKPKHLPPPHPSSAMTVAAAPGDRRCSHCGVQKTPQWRAGPEGAKTLCNACGVRYKSGRLLPEYRPACSPTFVSEIHSNSHRKVLEMRRKKDDGPLTATAPAVASF